MTSIPPTPASQLSAEKTHPSAPPRAVVLHTRVVTGTGGGPDKTILNSPRFLNPHGYKTLCAYMHPPHDDGFAELHRRSQQLDAELLSVPDRGFWDLRVIPRMLDICRRERVTIWDGHDYKSNALGLLLRRFWPMRLVTTVHGWGVCFGRTPLYYKIDRFCLKYYDRVICVSDTLFQQCLDAGVPRQRCTLIENAIDLETYRRQRTVEQAKRQLGFPVERILIGAIGRLSDEKGFDLLIRSIKQLVDAGLDVGLWIVGQGNERQRLEALVQQLELTDRVSLLGYRSNTIDLYQALDIFALSSLREGLPNVLLEAMALNVPVVSTRVAGVPRLIEHRTNGLLIDCNSTDQLSTALYELATAPELRTSLASAGYHTIQRRHNFSTRMQKIRDVYDSLLSTE